MKKTNINRIKQWLKPIKHRYNTFRKTKIYYILHDKIWINIRMYVHVAIILSLFALRGTGAFKYIILYYVGWTTFAVIMAWEQIVRIRHFTETVLFGRPLHLFTRKEWKSGKVKMKKCDWTAWRKKKNGESKDRKRNKKGDKK